MICKNCGKETDDKKAKCQHCWEIAKVIFEKTIEKNSESKRYIAVEKQPKKLVHFLIVLALMLIVLVIVITTSLISSEEPRTSSATTTQEKNKKLVDEFRGFKWGTTKTEIVNSYMVGSTPYFDRKENCIFYDNCQFLNKQARIKFYFDKNEELYGGEIVIETDDWNFYDYVKKAIMEKYNHKEENKDDYNFDYDYVYIGKSIRTDQRLFYEIELNHNNSYRLSDKIEIKYYDLERTERYINGRDNNINDNLKNEL